MRSVAAIICVLFSVFYSGEKKKNCAMDARVERRKMPRTSEGEASEEWLC